MNVVEKKNKKISKIITVWKSSDEGSVFLAFCYCCSLHPSTNTNIFVPRRRKKNSFNNCVRVWRIHLFILRSTHISSNLFFPVSPTTSYTLCFFFCRSDQVGSVFKSCAWCFQDIPVAFFLKHLERNNKRKTAKLRSDASETTWRVEIDGQRLSDGWEDFAVGHDLRLGDIVIFRHEGELVFHVTALGPSCSEIQYGGYSDEEEDKKGKS